MSRRAEPRGWQNAPALTVSETANVLGVSRSLLYEWVAAGRVTTVHLESRQVVTRGEVERLLAEVQGQRTPEPEPLFREALPLAVAVEPAGPPPLTPERARRLLNCPSRRIQAEARRALGLDPAVGEP